MPYYPDYCTHGKHGPRLGIPDNGAGYCCPGSPPGPGAVLGYDLPVGVESSSKYGYYTGASQDETALLHLGGRSAASSATRPSDAPADLIDLIQSGQ